MVTTDTHGKEGDQREPQATGWGRGRGVMNRRQQKRLGLGWGDFHMADQENPQDARPLGSISRIVALESQAIPRPIKVQRG